VRPASGTLERKKEITGRSLFSLGSARRGSQQRGKDKKSVKKKVKTDCEKNETYHASNFVFKTNDPPDAADSNGKACGNTLAVKRGYRQQVKSEERQQAHAGECEGEHKREK